MGYRHIFELAYLELAVIGRSALCVIDNKELIQIIQIILIEFSGAPCSLRQLPYLASHSYVTEKNTRLL